METGDGAAEFNRLSQLAASNVQKFSHNAGSVQRMVNQLGTPQDSTGLRTQLHEIQHYTNALAKDTGQLLGQLSQLVQSSSPEQRTQRKLQQERLMNDFTTTLKNFQAAQRQAAEKEKDSVLRTRANSGIPGNPFVDDGTESTTKPWENFDDAPAQSTTRLQIEQDVDIQAIKEREGAIKQLEDDILDVNQIFKDLALMVHEQGEVVDNIESNVETAVTQVGAAATDIHKARDYKRGLRKKRVICFVLVVVVIIVLALIIYFSVPHNKKN